jgi:uncharacterized membrane protein
MSKHRLEAFCDGVFAIVITLLVLDVRPEGGGASSAEMILHVWPKILTFVLSFLIVGVYWVAHHSMLHFVTATNRTFLWLNLLLLLTIAFIPYPTSLMGATRADAGSIMLYGGVLFLANAAGSALWLYATQNHRLVSPELPRRFSRFVVLLHFSPALLYAVAVLCAAEARIVSLTIFVAVPVFFILPNRLLDRKMNDAMTREAS